MLKKEFEAMFKNEMMPHLKEMYPNDKTLWRTVWNDTVDEFNKDGKITDKQAQNWTHPSFLKGGK